MDLKNIIKTKSLQYGEFTLSSGLLSSYYIDLKKTTLDPEGLAVITQTIFNKILEHCLLNIVDSIGGMDLGALPIVSALMLKSYNKQFSLRGFVIRKSQKNYGTKNRIEGNLRHADHVILIEDVVTTGKSILEAVDILQNEHCVIGKIIAVVDRNQGAREEFVKVGIPYEYIFDIKELLT
mgnify:CR=1 FL=1